MRYSIENKKISIIGLGYVGLPLALELCKKYSVIGFDLDKTRINEIRRKDLKTFFDKLLINGLSPGTILLVKAPISGVLSFAVDSELIENNPLDSLKLKHKKRSFKVEPLTDDEAAKLLEEARLYMGGYYYPHILCALRTGMRIGEIMALKWKDIDFP